MKKVSEVFGKIGLYVRTNPTEIIFGAYFFVIMSASVFASTAGGGKYHFGLVLFATLVLYVVFSLTPKVHNFVSKIAFSAPDDTSKKTKRKIFAIGSGITFAVLLVCYMANYPGAFSPDSFSQYSQAVTGNYSDWHPAWHTLLFFTLPLKLTGNWIGSILFFQMIYFSLFMGYFALTVYLYAGTFYATFASALILLSPFTLEIVMYPWKDVAFALAAGFSMIFSVRIYFTKGEWSNKIYRIALFAFMLSSATIFRHNGILFTFFLAIALLFFMPKKQWLLLVALTATLFVFIKVPVYSALNVEKPAKRTLETMGLPLSVIVNVAKECPNKLDDTTSQFITELTVKQPNWKQLHNISGFNSIKWAEGGINNDAIEKAGMAGILKMMSRCFAVAPKQSLMAVGGLTIPVYGLEVACRASNSITENDFSISYKGIKPLWFLEKAYAVIVSKTPLKYIFSCIGSTILAMLAFILFKSDFRSWSDWKRIFLCIPIFTYNFGTMLLLTGHDVRFFYVSFLVCPLVILILCGKQSEASQ